MIDLFEFDILRGAHFKRSDPFLQIDDQTSHPITALDSQLTDSKSRLEDAFNALIDLTLNSEREKWLPVLQLAVVQTNLNGAFSAPSFELTKLGSEIQWTTEKKQYALLPVIPENFPPTQLEIVRDLETNEIKQINVSLEGSMNLVKKEIGVNEQFDETIETTTEESIELIDEEIIIENIVKIKIEYSINFDLEEKLVISKLKSSCNTSIFN